MLHFRPIDMRACAVIGAIGIVGKKMSIAGPLRIYLEVFAIAEFS
jgi:hypothetical protein